MVVVGYGLGLFLHGRKGLNRIVFHTVFFLTTSTRIVTLLVVRQPARCDLEETDYSNFASSQSKETFLEISSYICYAAFSRPRVIPVGFCAGRAYT